MKIAMIGAGYVGLVTGACLSDLGHEIICVDIDKDRVAKLQKGIIPIYEPGLKEIIERNTKEERLAFTTDLKNAVSKSTTIFIAVGTPQDEDGSADLSYVIGVAKDIASHITDYKVIVIKSTVPVGTSDIVARAIKSIKPNANFDMVSNPEFLREGNAVDDFMIPDRIVIGSSSEKSREVMHEVYYGIERAGRPIVYTDVKSAEIIKYASNAMLATRISFINMMSQLCEKTGANIREVAKGIGLDTRIGHRFLHAGIGYGGSCFPKDVKAIMNTLEKSDCDFGMMFEVDKINKRQRQRFIDKICSKIEPKGKKFAIWGLAFKPRTDDMREAPSLDIINSLMEKGANIVAFDPVAEENAKKIITGKNIKYVAKPYDALQGADALIINTEWDEFRNLDYSKVKELMKAAVIFDGRNIYELDIMKKNGFKYYSIGRVEVE